MIDRIEYFKSNTKKKSLNLTLRNWLKKEHPKSLNNYPVSKAITEIQPSKGMKSI